MIPSFMLEVSGIIPFINNSYSFTNFLNKLVIVEYLW